MNPKIKTNITFAAILIVVVVLTATLTWLKKDNERLEEKAALLQVQVLTLQQTHEDIQAERERLKLTEPR